MASPCAVTASTDIVGIGIRINTYFTMLLLPIIPRTPSTEELLGSLYATAGLTGFGLLFTAIIQTGLQKLSLFEALFILHLLFFLGAGVSPMGKYNWTKGRVIMGVLVQFVSVVAFTTWGLYVWAHVKDFSVKNFGNERARLCNDQIKYVVFFSNVRATVPWLRGIWITALALSAVGLILTFGWKAMALFEMKRMAEEEAEEAACREVIVAPGTVPHVENETEGKEKEKEWYFDISFTLLLSAIYATVMLELMVHRNLNSGAVRLDGESWAFGQVLSVVMILANINELLHFLFGLLARRKHRLQRQSQAEEIGLQERGHSAPTFHRSRGPSGSNVPIRDQSTDKISTGYEHRNDDKTNTEVFETVTVSNLQAQDQPVGTLR